MIKGAISKIVRKGISMKLKNANFRAYILKIAASFVEEAKLILPVIERYEFDVAGAVLHLWKDPKFQELIISKDDIYKMIEYLRNMGTTQFDEAIFSTRQFNDLYKKSTGKMGYELPLGVNLERFRGSILVKPQNPDETAEDMDRLVESIYDVLNKEILEKYYLSALKNKEKLENILRKSIPPSSKFVKDLTKFKRKSKPVDKEEEYFLKKPYNQENYFRTASMPYKVLETYLNSFNGR